MSNDRKPKRKYREIPSVRSTPQEARATIDTVRRITGRMPLEEIERSPDIALPKTTSLSEVAPPKIEAAKTDSLVTDERLGYSIGSLPESTRPSQNEQPINLMASLPEVDGYVKLWHQLTDHLYKLLTTAEQAVHIQLFRLSWGHGKPSCVIGLPKLAERIGTAESTVQRAVEGLVKKGLIRKEKHIFGKNREQGVEYFVEPPSSLVKSLRLAKTTSLSEMSSNKEYIKKEPKMLAAHADLKDCPICNGTGFYYPDGVEKGVAKCVHK